MKTWKRLVSGLLALALAASLAGSALAAEEAEKEAPKPAGQFSQWFSRLGVAPKAPKASEEVLSRMGTVIQQSKTAGDTTVTLHAAVWDGTDMWLSFSIESPNIPEEVQQYTPLISEKSYRKLRDDQWREYTRNMLEESYAGSELSPEQVEAEIQAALNKGQSSGMLLTPEERKGNTLTFQVNDGLFCSRWFTETEQPELTLHLENLRPYDGGEVFLKGPFDFTFTLEKLIPPVRYEGAGVKTTAMGVPLRFTGFQLSALELTAFFDDPMEPLLPRSGETLTPEKKRELDRVMRDTYLASSESVRGVWTKDGKYVDLTNSGGSGSGSAVSREYPYPIDPAAVTAVNIGGTRVELIGLKLTTD
ncbi:MAG: DUF4179 domain-containing protein [Oscillibacter sp.]|nr:DUF4179 domain-containing protein [Oscillibacter sp.]